MSKPGEPDADSGRLDVHVHEFVRLLKLKPENLQLLSTGVGDTADTVFIPVGKLVQFAFSHKKNSKKDPERQQHAPVRNKFNLFSGCLAQGILVMSNPSRGATTMLHKSRGSTVHGRRYKIPV